MRVLVVLPQPPHPEGSAAGRCAVGLLRGLTAHGVEVVTVAGLPEYAAARSSPEGLAVEIVPIPPDPGGWRSRLERLRRPGSELARGPLGARVRELARDVDLIHLEQMETAWCDDGLATPALLQLHHLTREDPSPGISWRKDFRDVLERRLAERIAVRRHRFLVANSPYIARALRRQAPAAEVVLAPLSLDPEHYPQAELADPPTAGIIGTASWPPTAAAITRLVTRVWPLVRRRLPDARLLVAGRGVEELPSLAARLPGVELAGQVPSSPAFLSSLSLLLFPLERGSGMKVKVLEAIACGVPVVTTRAGAEGIEAEEGLVVEEEDERLADAAVGLLTSSAERRERGRAARAAFERRYAPGPATAPLVQLYRRMYEAGR